jgi:hypothetical protein
MMKGILDPSGALKIAKPLQINDLQGLSFSG